MTQISKIFRVVISALLAMLGFSCSKGFGGRDHWGVAEYGVPHATYKVKGVVVSEEDNSPIEGIRAELKTDSNYMYTMDTTFTDNNGYFFLTGSEFPRLKLIVELVDVNDGSFVSMEIEADFTNKTFTGGSGGWYDGEAEIDLGIIQMKPE